MASHINADNISSPTIFHPLIKPPYYVCIFTSRLNLSEPNAIDGYAILADEMEELAKHSEGYLGIDSSTRNTDGMGITISYWSTENAIKSCKLILEQRSFWARIDSSLIIMFTLPKLSVSMRSRDQRHVDSESHYSSKLSFESRKDMKVLNQWRNQYQEPPAPCSNA
jgi:heme-degrading monooxygenase HmoA